MDEVVKSLLNNYLNKIAENDFTSIYYSLYDRFFKDRRFHYIGMFTETLLDADINPLLYMKDVPPRYLYASRNIEYLYIPSHIKNIHDNAFANSNIKEIDIPIDCKIGREAFRDCNIKVHRYSKF